MKKFRCDGEGSWVDVAGRSLTNVPSPDHFATAYVIFSPSVSFLLPSLDLLCWAFEVQCSPVNQIRFSITHTHTFLTTTQLFFKWWSVNSPLPPFRGSWEGLQDGYMLSALSQQILLFLESSGIYEVPTSPVLWTIIISFKPHGLCYGF